MSIHDHDNLIPPDDIPVIQQPCYDETMIPLGTVTVSMEEGDDWDQERKDLIDTLREERFRGTDRMYGLKLDYPLPACSRDGVVIGSADCFAFPPPNTADEPRTLRKVKVTRDG